MDGGLGDGRLARDNRVVCHVDMDCFYAACERLREPALEDEPLVVGMGYEPGETIGAVATASYEAREFGVESAQPISQALDALPRKVDAVSDPDLDPDDAGHYRPVDMDYYKEVSAQVSEVVEDAVREADPDGVVREVSIDEAYLDVSAVGWDRAREFAETLKGRIDEEVGVVASIGVAPNMSTAKVASDYDKPDGLVVVEPDGVPASNASAGSSERGSDGVREFLAPLPVEELHGVGPVTAGELAELGVETAGDLAEADVSELTDRFGERGREIYDHARGHDDREVTPVGKPKSLSSEKALEPTDDTERKRGLVESLASEVAGRARSEGALYRTIGIKVVVPPYDVNTRARSLPGPVDDPDLVEEVALDLLTEFDDVRTRKLGVRVSKLDFSDADQASLDGWDDEAGGGDPDPQVERPGSDRESGEPSGQASLNDFQEKL